MSRPDFVKYVYPAKYDDYGVAYNEGETPSYMPYAERIEEQRARNEALLVYRIHKWNEDYITRSKGILDALVRQAPIQSPSNLFARNRWITEQLESRVRRLEAGEWVESIDSQHLMHSDELLLTKYKLAVWVALGINHEYDERETSPHVNYPVWQKLSRLHGEPYADEYVEMFKRRQAKIAEVRGEEWNKLYRIWYHAIEDNQPEFLTRFNEKTKPLDEIADKRLAEIEEEFLLELIPLVLKYETNPMRIEI